MSSILRKAANHDTGFQRLAVWESDREAEFRVAGAAHAWWHRDRFLTGLAWDCIAAAALLRAGGPPRSVLMLGVAGGTSLRVLRHLLPQVAITAVEIDRGIIDLARRHMQLDELKIDLHYGDAYAWVRENSRRFDVVIDDVYRAVEHDVVRPGIYDEETGASLLRAVAPGGLFIVNLITGAGHRRMQSAFRRFFRGRFSATRRITTPAGANECLAGGDAILTGRALTTWKSEFQQSQDRQFWQGIQVRLL